MAAQERNTSENRELSPPSETPYTAVFWKTCKDEEE